MLSRSTPSERVSLNTRMKRLGELSMIIGVSLALALVAFAFRPAALPWDISKHEIDLSAALQIEGSIWVDARAIEDFENGTYDGAIPVNEESWEEGFAGLLDVWTPDVSIVVFCSSHSCLRSHHVAQRLREELGVEEVFTLKDGWESLLEAGKVQ